MAVCPSCRGQVNDGQRFCTHCGGSMPGPAAATAASGSQKVFCEQCKRELGRTMKFCKYCGAVQSMGTQTLGQQGSDALVPQAENTNNFSTMVQPGMGQSGDVGTNNFATLAQPMPGPSAPSPQQPTEYFSPPSNPTADQPTMTQRIGDFQPRGTDSVNDDRTQMFQENTSAQSIRPSAPVPPSPVTGGRLDQVAPVLPTDQFGNYRTDELRQPPVGSAPTMVTPAMPPRPSEPQTPPTDRFGTVVDNQLRAVPMPPERRTEYDASAPNFATTVAPIPAQPPYQPNTYQPTA